MKEYFVFYVLLIVLIILLVFIILLYSDYHSRTIAPSLLTSNYRIETVESEWSELKINVDTSQSDGSISFGDGSGSSTNTVSFIPMAGDEKRRLSGVITLLLGSSSNEGRTIRLRVVDDQTGKVVGDESQFLVPDFTSWGLSPIRLFFKADQLNPSSIASTDHHQIVVEAKSTSGNIDDLVLNSAYVSYY